VWGGGRRSGTEAAAGDPRRRSVCADALRDIVRGDVVETRAAVERCSWSTTRASFSGQGVVCVSRQLIGAMGKITSCQIEGRISKPRVESAILGDSPSN
jgi:SRSO17 transposase